MKRSVGVGAITLCVALAACNDDKCNGPNRDAAGCRSGGHGGGSGYVGSRGSSEGSSSTAHGGFGATGSSSGGSSGE